MPDRDFLHRHPEFEGLILNVAGQRDIDPYLAEKDYWIMHCLFGLRRAGYDFQLKGGTSLSKGHGLIHRFSEDVDVHISPPAGLDLKTGKNHNRPRHVQGRKTIATPWPKRSPSMTSGPNATRLSTMHGTTGAAAFA